MPSIIPILLIWLAATPAIRQPVLFDTPEADAIVGLQVFPPDNPWNQDVSHWPLHPNSRKIIASIGAEKPLRTNERHGLSSSCRRIRSG